MKALVNHPNGRMAFLMMMGTTSQLAQRALETSRDLPEDPTQLWDSGEPPVYSHGLCMRFKNNVNYNND